jgi:hypothetical protein
MRLSASFLSIAALNLASAFSVPSKLTIKASPTTLHAVDDRRSFLSNVAGAMTVASWLSIANADDDDFASIAARASKISAAMESEQPQQQNAFKSTDTRTIYDFSLPIAGDSVDIRTLVQKDTVKAILVVNMKQDDPIARKNIPELIALASK